MGRARPRTAPRTIRVSDTISWNVLSVWVRVSRGSGGFSAEDFDATGRVRLLEREIGRVVAKFGADGRILLPFRLAAVLDRQLVVFGGCGDLGQCRRCRRNLDRGAVGGERCGTARADRFFGSQHLHGRLRARGLAVGFEGSDQFFVTGDELRLDIEDALTLGSDSGGAAFSGAALETFRAEGLAEVRVVGE